MNRNLHDKYWNFEQLLMKSGIGIGTHYEMGIFLKLLAMTTVALKNCPSSELGLGQTVLVA